MFSLLLILFGALMGVTVAFWVLFFFVVQVRIADRNLDVQEDSPFGFQWPHEEMRAYLASLAPQERRKPVNLFLRSASRIHAGLFAAYAVALVIVMLVGSDP